MRKRNLDISVISDVHLGSPNAHAQEILHYLNSIAPKQLIVNGDLVDRSYFKRKSLPNAHLKVLRRIVQMSLEGTKVYYLPGNHDDAIRKTPVFKTGSIIKRDKLELKIGAHKYLIMHGDIFDAKLFLPRNVVAMGDKAYGSLVSLNRYYNNMRKRLGYEPFSLSMRIKTKIEKAQLYIAKFREEVFETARKQGYTHIICGHIHIPIIEAQEQITYLNSGDWVENLSALEFQNDTWRIFQYDPAEFDMSNPKLKVRPYIRSNRHKKITKKILQQD